MSIFNSWDVEGDLDLDLDFFLFVGEWVVVLVLLFSRL